MQRCWYRSSYSCLETQAPENRMLTLTQFASSAVRTAVPTKVSLAAKRRSVLSRSSLPIKRARADAGTCQLVHGHMRTTVCRSHTVYAGSPKVEGEV